MAITVRSIGSSSRPENVKLTQELERRFKEQEDAKQAGNSKAPGLFKIRTSDQQQP
jgi:hypothetical protein